MTLRNWNGGSMKFFFVQAVGTHIETVAIEVRKRLFGEEIGSREGRFWKVLGYVWVWQWFVLTVPLMFDPLLAGGLGEPIRNMPLPGEDLLVFVLRQYW